MILQHGTIHTMAGETIEQGYIVIQNGVIEQVGTGDLLHVEDEDIIDLKGAHVYPGFIDAHTHLGIFEDGLNFEGDDCNEDTEPITPHLRAIDAINPMENCFREALEGGVTTVVTGPGSANPISGQLAAIKTYGNCIDRMIVKAPLAIKMALGENPKSVYHDKSQTPVTRMATAALIREQLHKAKHYLEDKKRALEDEDSTPPEYDLKCEALIPALEKEIQVHFHAHRADDIFTAIRLAKEFGLDYVIVHGSFDCGRAKRRTSQDFIRSVFVRPLQTGIEKSDAVLPRNFNEAWDTNGYHYGPPCNSPAIFNSRGRSGSA